MAVAIVCEAEGLAGRVDGDVEGVFRNVDADVLCQGEFHLFSVLILYQGP
jgi:hypothetical protein